MKWTSFWFERQLEIQRRLIPNVRLTADPIFVLGLWRSGTTHLHNLLANCPDMIVPVTWQCMNAASVSLRDVPPLTASIKRPMDGIPIATLSPQEDEFALLSLGVPSVYRGFFDPRRLPELAHWLEPNSWRADFPEGWIAVLREFLSRVGHNRTGRFLLKSPSHTFRIRALATEFPNAAYVWLCRDPVELFFSNCKMWTAMFEQYALWDWTSTVLDEFLATAIFRAAQCLREIISTVPSNRLVVVDFTRLARDPIATIEAINQRVFLGNWSDLQEPLLRAAATSRGYRPDTYRLQPPRALTDVIDSLQSAQDTAIKKYGI